MDSLFIVFKYHSLHKQELSTTLEVTDLATYVIFLAICATYTFVAYVAYHFRNC